MAKSTTVKAIKATKETAIMNIPTICSSDTCSDCANIRNFRSMATDYTVAMGSIWYSTMAAKLQREADSIGRAIGVVAAVYAAHSANTKWDRNVFMAERNIDLFLKGEIDQMSGTLGANIHKAGEILTTWDDVDYSRLVQDRNNHKVRNFTCNLQDVCTHETECVTCDRWAFRIARNFEDCTANGQPCAKNGRHNCGRVPTGAEYLTMAACYRKIAAEFNERPLVTQAITWVVVTGTTAE